MSVPNTPDGEKAAPRKKQRTLGRRVGAQVPVLVIIGAFVIAAAIFLFREIGSHQSSLSSGSDPIVFRSDSAEGIIYGTQLQCQGLTIGRVKRVLAENDPAGGKISFRIEAALDGPYANWNFKPDPIVRVGLIRTDYVSLNTIELQYDGTSAKPQRDFSLVFDSGEGSNMQDDATALLASLASSHQDVTRRIDSGEATTLEKTLWNSAESAEKIRTAISQITDDVDGPSTIKEFQTSVGKLSRVVDDLGAQVTILTKESTELVGLSKQAVDQLNGTIQRMEKNSLDFLGETPAQRRAVRSEIVSTLEGLQGAASALRDLAQRTGDTGMGRLIIKKKEPERAGSESR